MTKRQCEQEIVSQMIRLFCKKKHHCKELCTECSELEKYAHTRLRLCRYGDKKGFCAHCPTKCYQATRREQLKIVMRFSGPYMLLYHPLLFFRHLYKNIIHK